MYNKPSLYNLLVNSDSPDIRNARLHLELCTEKRRGYKFQKGTFQLERRQKKKITVSVIGEGSGADCVGKLWDLPSLEIFNT